MHVATAWRFKRWACWERSLCGVWKSLVQVYAYILVAQCKSACVSSLCSSTGLSFPPIRVPVQHLSLPQILSSSPQRPETVEPSTVYIKKNPCSQRSYLNSPGLLSLSLPSLEPMAQVREGQPDARYSVLRTSVLLQY